MGIDLELKKRLIMQSQAGGIKSKTENNIIMLDERPSKIRKSMNPGNGRDAAITSKIVEKLDRRSAHSQSGKSSGVLRNSLNTDPNILTSEEQVIIEAPHEIAVRYDHEKRLMKVIQGDKNQVTVPRTEKGDTITHNHPGGLGPSDTDLMKVLIAPMDELRIVANQNGKNVLYRLISKDDVDEGLAEEIMIFYQNAMMDSRGELIKAPSQRDVALELTLDEFGSTYLSR